MDVIGNSLLFTPWVFETQSAPRLGARFVLVGFV